MPKYLDTYHTNMMEKARVAFEKFNDELASIDDNGMLELTEAVLSFGDAEPYCRVYYADGDAFVEPIYNPIRDLDDR